jgi:hypothetical protein
MKTKYNVGDTVFALNTIDNEAISLHKVKIISIFITNIVEYEVTEYDGSTWIDWENNIKEENINKNATELANKLKL